MDDKELNKVKMEIDWWKTKTNLQVDSEHYLPRICL